MRKLQAVLVSLTAVALAGGAGAATITFDEDDVALVHGSLVSSQYAGVTISATDRKGRPKPAVAFDSDRSHTRDRDLEFGDGWKRGNLSDPPVPLGNLLIINENEKLCWTGVCSKPESDEDGGSLIFEFDAPLLSLGFDLIDIDGKKKKDKDGHGGWDDHDDWDDHGGWDGRLAATRGGRDDDRDHDWDHDHHGDRDDHHDWDRDDDDHHGHGDKKSELDGSIIFTDSTTGVSVKIGMMEFLAGYEVGNNSANRIAPFLASELGLDSFDIVEIRLKGTAAIDNLTFEVVPEPATLGLLGLGVAALAARARARRR